MNKEEEYAKLCEARRAYNCGEISASQLTAVEQQVFRNYPSIVRSDEHYDAIADANRLSNAIWEAVACLEERYE